MEPDPKKSKTVNESTNLTSLVLLLLNMWNHIFVVIFQSYFWMPILLDLVNLQEE